MTELDLDLEPTGDAFEAAYALPADLPDDLRALHAEIITALRNESRAVSVGTNVKMLVERMAYFYIAMKYRELTAAEPLSLKEQKEMLDFWLKIHSEYNRLITSAESKSRVALLESVMEVLRDSLSEIEDPEKQMALQATWRKRFGELGI